MAKYKFDTYNIETKKRTTNNLVSKLTEENISTSKVLLSQVVKSFLVNQRQGTQSVKTRGEVSGSTRKIYRQKGTGRARHGDIKAPLFVGGGVVFAPHPRNFENKINKKTGKKTLIISFLEKVNSNKFIVIEGLEKVKAKTKELVNIFNDILDENIKKRKVLLINGENKNLLLAARNIIWLKTTKINNINTYNLLVNDFITVDKNIFSELLKKLDLEVENKNSEMKKVSKITRVKKIKK